MPNSLDLHPGFKFLLKLIPMLDIGNIHRVYECSSCKAILDEKDIVITLDIKHCPVCGCETLNLLKLED